MNEHSGLWGIPSFFPTPRPLIEAMLAKIDIQPGDTILEPSAGHGAIARVIRERYPNNRLLVIEKDVWLRMHLLRERFELVGSDFMRYTGKVDWVIQNPPFSNNYQDADHFCQAWRVARKGVVSLLHEYTAMKEFGRTDYKPAVFQRWLNSIGAERELNPEGSFLQGGAAFQCEDLYGLGDEMARPIKGIFENVRGGEYSEFTRVYVWLNDEWKMPMIVSREQVRFMMPRLDNKCRPTGYTDLWLKNETDAAILADTDADELAKWLCNSR